MQLIDRVSRKALVLAASAAALLPAATPLAFPDRAGACATWYYSPANVLPGQLRGVVWDAFSAAPYSQRRARWNSGNRHLTATSYSYYWAPDVYEVVDIEAYSTASKVFNNDHPSYYNGYVEGIDIRIRNKGDYHTLNPSGQTCL